MKATDARPREEAAGVAQAQRMDSKTAKALRVQETES